MTKLDDYDLNAIKYLHDRWIALELDGKGRELIDLCTQDIQWIPPNSPPLVGQDAIAQFVATTEVKITKIDISNLKIAGAGPVACLTSNYRTQFLTNSQVCEAAGTHLWILRKEESGSWLVAVVAWSVWTE